MDSFLQQIHIPQVNTSNWVPKQPQITEKTLFSHSFEIFSDKVYFEFVSFSENGEFVAPNNATLAIVFLQGGNGKKISDASADKSLEIQIAQWDDMGNNGSYTLSDNKGDKLYAGVGGGNWDRIWNRVTVYATYTYAVDARNNGWTSSFGKYKSVLGGHSNRGAVKMQLHLTNQNKTWTRRTFHDNGYSSIGNIWDEYMDTPTTGEIGFTIVRLQPNEVVPISVGSGGHVIVSYLNILKNSKGKTIDLHNASINDVIEHIPISKPIPTIPN